MVLHIRDLAISFGASALYLDTEIPFTLVSTLLCMVLYLSPVYIDLTYVFWPM